MDNYKTACLINEINEFSGKNFSTLKKFSDILLLSIRVFSFPLYLAVITGATAIHYHPLMTFATWGIIVISIFDFVYLPCNIASLLDENVSDHIYTIKIVFETIFCCIIVGFVFMEIMGLPTSSPTQITTQIISVIM